MARRELPRRLVALLGLLVVAACTTESPSPSLPPAPVGVIPWGGIAWLEPEVADVMDGSTHLVAVDHGPAGYVAVGFADAGPDRDGLILHSTDGTAWEDVSGLASEGLDIVDVAANDDAYVAVAQAIDPVRTVLLSSVDGRHWIRVQPPAGSIETYGHDIAAGPDGFLAAGGDPTIAAVWRSADGSTWEALPGDGPTSADHGLNSLAATDGGWAALGQNVAAPSILQSADGVAWFAAMLPSDDDQRAYELTIGGTGWHVAGGEGSCGPLSSCPEGPVGWWSSDGRTWTLVPAGTTPVRPGAGALIPVGDAGFVWVDGQTAMAGPDALRFTEIGGLADETLGVASGIAVGERVVVVGERWQPDGSSVAAVSVGDRIGGD